METINAYDMHHNKKKTWNTFSNEINNLRNDLFILTYGNRDTVGEMPEDIKRQLKALCFEINNIF